MGLFFEESKSTKPFIIIKRMVAIIWLIVMLIAVITSIMTSFDNIYIRLLIILTGVSSIINGIEHYVRRDNRWLYLSEIGIGILCLVLLFIFS
jgi:hypothetical protein